MSWIESHQSLARHRKVIALVSLLKADRHKLIGHLHELWWWGLDNADEDGQIGTLSEEAIAIAAGWPERDAPRFVAALVSAGFLDQADEVYFLHDWYDYAGKLNAKRAGNKARQQALRDRRQGALRHGLVTRDVTPDVTPDVTGSNALRHALVTGLPTVPTEPTPIVPRDDTRDGDDPWTFDHGFRDRYGTLITALGGQVSAANCRKFQDIAEEYSQPEIDAALKACTLANVRSWPNEVISRLPKHQPSAANPEMGPDVVAATLAAMEAENAKSQWAPLAKKREQSAKGSGS